MAIKVVKYVDYAAFKVEDKLVRRNGVKSKERFVQHTIKALDCFHDGGNHNIQIINDIGETATVSGYQKKKVLEWLEPVVGHVLDKNVFGKKVEGLDYNTLDLGAHFEAYADWYAFSKDNPSDWAPDTSRDKLIKSLTAQSKKAEENGYREMSSELSVMVNMLHGINLTIAQPANAEDVAQVEVQANAA